MSFRIFCQEYNKQFGMTIIYAKVFSKQHPLMLIMKLS